MGQFRGGSGDPPPNPLPRLPRALEVPHHTGYLGGGGGRILGGGVLVQGVLSEFGGGWQEYGDPRWVLGYQGGI